MQKGNLYAVTHGKYLGKFLIYMESDKGFHNFLMMPGNFNVLFLKKLDFINNLFENKDDLLKKIYYFEFVEQLPDKILETFEAQYKETKKNKNNWISDVLALK